MSSKSFKILILIAVALLFFYFPSFNNFFFQDDFFNMKMSQEQNLGNAFNIFKKPIRDFYFYRPLSTQFYWTIGQNIFGLNPIGYHIINFALFLLTVFLVYKLANMIVKNEKVALLTTFFYAFSASHFYRLFFLSQVQELIFAIFTFTAIILFLQGRTWAILMFALALASKETTAMLIPFFFLIILIFKKTEKRYFLISLYSFAIMAFYLFARFFYFGFAKGGAYGFDFGPKKILNNYFWYGLWSLGLPESFVNLQLFKFPSIINPKVFTAFESWGVPTLISFIFFGLLMTIPLVKRFIKFDRIIFFGIVFFFIFLVPVGFFPFHKFPYSLTVPLFGSSLILGYALAKFGKRTLFFICAAYLALFLSAYQFNLSNHWARRKADQSQRVFEFFKTKFPQKPKYANIYFRNNLDPICPYFRGVASFSQEISYAIGDTDGLRILYKNDIVPIYFEDLDKQKNMQKGSLILDSRMFF